MVQKGLNTDSRKGYTAAVCFSILVGFSFLGIKICQEYTDSLNVLCYRYDFAFVVMMLLVLFRIVKIEIRHKPKTKLMLTAAFYVGFMALQVMGLSYSTSVEGSIIFAIIPIVVKIIASLFLGEKSSWLENGFMGLTVAALLLMLIMGATDIVVKPLGTVLLLLSSVAMALSNVFMRYTKDDYRPIEKTYAIIVMGFIAFNLAAIVRGFMFDYNFADYFQPLMTPQVSIAGGYLGIGCILLSAQLMSYMMTKMPAVNASIFGNVSTMISIVAGVLILGEPLRWYHVICAIVIIIGVIGLSASGGREDKGEKELGQQDKDKISGGEQNG